jgi:anti-sigma factor RsiW
MSPIGDDDLQAYVDGRLAGERLQAVSAYLAAHPEKAAEVTREQQQRAELRTALQAKFNEPLPARLRIAQIRTSRRQARMRQLQVAAVLVCVLLTGAAGGWAARGALLPGAATSPVTFAAMGFTRDAVSAYRTFVVEKRHAVEVDAADEKHLVTWLSKRLGRPLQAPDLGSFGFRLMGGRLLPATDTDADGNEGNVAAAQFMYEREDGRRMTLYVRAGSGAETAFRFSQAGDVATFAWIDQGFGFALTAPSDRAQLLPVAEAVYQAYETVR